MPKTLTEQYQLWMEAGATFADVRKRIDTDYRKNKRVGQKINDDWGKNDLDRMRARTKKWRERNAQLRGRETGARNEPLAKWTARKQGSVIGLAKKPSRFDQIMHTIQQKTRRPWEDA